MAKSKVGVPGKKKTGNTAAQGYSKEKTAFKAQYTRTRLLNEVASAVNHMISPYAKQLKPGNSTIRTKPAQKRAK
jgi:hypothetical protein